MYKSLCDQIHVNHEAMKYTILKNRNYHCWHFQCEWFSLKVWLLVLPIYRKVACTWRWNTPQRIYKHILSSFHSGLRLILLFGSSDEWHTVLNWQWFMTYGFEVYFLIELHFQLGEKESVRKWWNLKCLYFCVCLIFCGVYGVRTQTVTAITRQTTH